MVAIIDYGVGNLNSIKNMLKKIGVDSVITSVSAEIECADKLILPGVGSFEYGMKKLRDSAFFDILQQKVLQNKTPILGVCLGAQLLLKGSEEGQPVPGLGWIEGKALRFDQDKMADNYKVPHMGWNELQVKKESRLFTDMYNNQRYYFVHAYHMACYHEADILAESNYSYNFVAAVEKENVLGVQFHPEKSHKFGMKLYENFIKFY
ncbi:MAG: imidazole glycerol phosphate synthase subunit HisH [Ferruginibacter sp.]|jgi:glutamine amidotransferase|nr:imidazole glycerol phosphate synthase subunit HisH [Ferruginibacter sp.]